MSVLEKEKVDSWMQNDSKSLKQSHFAYLVNGNSDEKTKGRNYSRKINDYNNRENLLFFKTPRYRQYGHGFLSKQSELTTGELMQIAQTGGAFNFLEDEPDLYTLEDGEPI
jgi:hypothetical protein